SGVCDLQPQTNSRFLFRSRTMHWSVRVLCVVASILIPLALGAQTQSGEQKARVKVQMRNVMYHFTDSVVVHIETLNGSVIPVGENKIPVFDDAKSFDIQIDSARIAISTSSLANVLNSYVFARPDAPLKGISVSIEKGLLKIKGKLHSKGDIPFETD